MSASQVDEANDLDLLCGEMAKALYLIRAGTAVVPNDTIAIRGYSRHRAVVLGHMVRLCKLFDAFYLHFAKGEVEICGIIARLVIETEIRLSYFMKFGLRRSTKTYILSSYRAEKACLDDLGKKSATRSLTPIEERMKLGIIKSLREDGLTLKELHANKVWDIDGKSVRAMLKALGREWEYGYSFAMHSSWVHGNWHELKSNHLERSGRYYLPVLEKRAADIRLGAPISIRCLEVARKYLSWSKADPDRVIRNEIGAVMSKIREIDDRDEERIRSGANI